MKTEFADDTAADVQLENLVEELADCIAEIEAASPAPGSEDGYEAVAGRVVELEAEIRSVAPTASDATRDRLRRTHTDEIGYVSDLL